MSHLPGMRSGRVMNHAVKVLFTTIGGVGGIAVGIALHWRKQLATCLTKSPFAKSAAISGGVGTLS